jgi:glutathione synthase/RimK-type ligase-like ATP-grasp enzyme
MIVIVTVRNDLHAVAVCGRIRQLGFPECHIVECDQLGQGRNIHYSLGLDDGSDWVVASDGRPIAISQARVIWLRRPRANQNLKTPLTQDEGYDLVNNDCRGALSGYLATHFTGKWISHPEATFRASDKIYQQKVARTCGFRVPKTIVTQSADEVEKFFKQCDGKIIVKTIVGADQTLETKRITDPAAFSEETYSASPAIYQEYIEGTRHLRLLNFGDRSLCGLIETDNLDWRMHLDDSITRWVVPDDVHDRVRMVIERLGLEMGIIDIKITPSGELVWLEVNPQGQFIFLEPLIGVPFIDMFSQYLIEEAKALA